MEQEAKEIAEILKVLSNENRLLIVCYLLQEPMTVSELNLKISNLTQSALSQHLSILKAHKIVCSSKKGLSITYSICDSRMRNVIKVLKENYCKI